MSEGGSKTGVEQGISDLFRNVGTGLGAVAEGASSGLADAWRSMPSGGKAALGGAAGIGLALLALRSLPARMLPLWALKLVGRDTETLSLEAGEGQLATQVESPDDPRLLLRPSGVDIPADFAYRLYKGGERYTEFADTLKWTAMEPDHTGDVLSGAPKKFGQVLGKVVSGVSKFASSGLGKTLGSIAGAAASLIPGGALAAKAVGIGTKLLGKLPLDKVKGGLTFGKHLASAMGNKKGEFALSQAAQADSALMDWGREAEGGTIEDAFSGLEARLDSLRSRQSIIPDVQGDLLLPTNRKTRATPEKYNHGRGAAEHVQLVQETGMGSSMMKLFRFLGRALKSPASKRTIAKLQDAWPKAGTATQAALNSEFFKALGALFLGGSRVLVTVLSNKVVMATALLGIVGYYINKNRRSELKSVMTDEQITRMQQLLALAEAGIMTQAQRDELIILLSMAESAYKGEHAEEVVELMEALMSSNWRGTWEPDPQKRALRAAQIKSVLAPFDAGLADAAARNYLVNPDQRAAKIEWLEAAQDSMGGEGRAYYSDLVLMASHSNFASQLAKPAAQMFEQYGANPVVMVWQAQLESAGGTSRLATQAKNILGLKAGGATSSPHWSGRTMLATDDQKDEPFRAYDSWDECVMDYGYIISSQDNFREALVTPVSDYRGYLEALARGGYATSDAYVKSVLAIGKQMLGRTTASSMTVADRAYEPDVLATTPTGESVRSREAVTRKQGTPSRHAMIGTDQSGLESREADQGRASQDAESSALTQQGGGGNLDVGSLFRTAEGELDWMALMKVLIPVIGVSAAIGILTSVIRKSKLKAEPVIHMRFQY